MPSNASKTVKSDLKSKEEQRMKDTFSEILFDLIKDNNTTSDMVSKSTDIAKGTMSNYLNAKTSPKPLELKKLADHFNVSTDYLLGRTNVKTVDIDIQAIHEKTGLSDKAIEKLINCNKDLDDLKVSEANVLSELLETEKFFEILNDIMWLGITAIYKLIYEGEKNGKKPELPSGKSLGTPIYELIEEDSNWRAMDRLMGGSAPLNPSETYSFYLNELLKDFGKIVETLIDEMHRDKSLTELNREIDELTKGLYKHYARHL
jgi:transcriptional regulator with XRE-family HTH domain